MNDMNDRKKKISIVTPVLDEEKNIFPFYERVEKVTRGLPQYDWEYFFTDNHSTDKTFDCLKELAGRDRRVKVLRLAKNFGYQHSIHTGYVSASGDAAIQLDCDLQDPPELIPKFLEKWEEGSKVVYGIRTTRAEGRNLQATRKIFYRLLARLGEDRLPPDAGDFRLVDRALLNELKKIHDRHPYLRGTIAAMGFQQTGIPYAREGRKEGKTKFSLRSMVSLAVDGILNHSIFPLRLASLTGLCISFLTLIGILVYTVGKLLFYKDWPAGFATTAVLILFSITLNSIFLGIIGEYLGRIYQQVKIKPLVVVETALNLEEPYESRHPLRG